MNKLFNEFNNGDNSGIILEIKRIANILFCDIYWSKLSIFGSVPLLINSFFISFKILFVFIFFF